jgi:hypothetical protein
MHYIVLHVCTYRAENVAHRPKVIGEIVPTAKLTVVKFWLSENN